MSLRWEVFAIKSNYKSTSLLSIAIIKMLLTFFWSIIDFAKCSYIIGHVLEDQAITEDQERRQLFRSFDLHFIGLVLLTVALFFGLSLVFLYSYERFSTARDQSKRKELRTISNCIFDSAGSRDLVYRLTNFGFLVFGFITVQLTINNIKTEKAGILFLEYRLLFKNILAIKNFKSGV